LAGPLFWLLRPQRSHAFAWFTALPPAAVTLWQALQLNSVASGNTLIERYAWAPTLGLEVALRLDGLALFFGLLITGIGTCIVFYTNYYLEGDRRQGYFYLVLYFFMASMLGLVWSDDLLTLFVFWEGTSITSYLLIAFKSEYKGAVEGARRALIVTTAGALAMLAGMVILGLEAGTFHISTILTTPGIATAAVTPVALALIFLGAFTKSAQFPFQFWLPGAMAAPTPASAYLHSATMVKAGIFLLARLHPAFSDLPLWFWSLFLVGGFTMVLGAVSAIRYTDMKALLAYATISVLGMLTMLLAFQEEYALKAFIVTVLAHALYKAPLFLSAGIVDHAMGTRDLRRLAGLVRALPIVALTVVLAAVSMAGVPPTMGFLAKELLLENFHDLFEQGETIIGGIGFAAATLAALFLGGAVFTLTWEAFLRGRPDEEAAHLHHAPSFWFAAPALLLTVIGASAALLTGSYEQVLLAPAIAAVAGNPVEVHLKLWHGLTPAFITSMAILVLAVVVCFARGIFRRLYAGVPERFSALAAYDATVDAIYRLAYRITTVIQGSPMAPQLSITLLAGVTVMLYAVFFTDGNTRNVLDSREVPTLTEWAIFALAIIAAITTVRAGSRLSAIIALGVVGVTVTLFFIIFSAPDLALTQLLIEVLTVFLLVLVFFRVKPDKPIAHDRREPFRLLVAVAMGFFGFAVVMVNHLSQVGDSISPYFIENSLELGRGTNVVNVILVDFRGYDTLGEITVLGLAALGGYALLRGAPMHTLRQRIHAARQMLSGAEAGAKREHETEAGHD